MSEKKIVVPDGMAQAAVEATCGTRLGMAEHDALIDKALEAALCWLSENPIVPTPQQVDSMRGPCGLPVFAYHGYTSICTEWQRRMFLAEPEVPEAIKDLMWHGTASKSKTNDRDAHNERVLEAYKRGKEGK